MLTASGSKKVTKKTSEIKYCSDRCRSRKPGALDRKIEKTIASLLNDEVDSGIDNTAARSKVAKGDPRLIVTMDEIEEVVFGSRFDPEKVFGRRKNRKSRAIPLKNGEWKSVDMESDSEPADEESEAEQAHFLTGEETDGSVASVPSLPSVDGGVRIRPPQEESEINFAAGGGERGKHEKIEESADDLGKRRQGAKRAEEREMVRRAARRIIIFGVEVPKRESYEKKPTKGKSKSKHVEADVEDVATTEMRKAEAMMAGMVVEPSFAKGNWAVRWRD